MNKNNILGPVYFFSFIMLGIILGILTLFIYYNYSEVEFGKKYYHMSYKDMKEKKNIIPSVYEYCSFYITDKDNNNCTNKFFTNTNKEIDYYNIVNNVLSYYVDQKIILESELDYLKFKIYNGRNLAEEAGYFNSYNRIIGLNVELKTDDIEILINAIEGTIHHEIGHYIMSRENIKDEYADFCNDTNSKCEHFITGYSKTNSKEDFAEMWEEINTYGFEYVENIEESDMNIRKQYIENIIKDIKQSNSNKPNDYYKDKEPTLHSLIF